MLDVSVSAPVPGAAGSFYLPVTTILAHLTPSCLRPLLALTQGVTLQWEAPGTTQEDSAGDQ